jgi:hypothetical protein
MRTLVLYLLAGFMALIGGQAVASDASLRCDGGLVRLGDGTWQVERACGEPDYQYHQKSVDIPEVGVIGPVEEWYYNLGAQRLVRVLYFRDGDLDRIAKAGYGFSSVVAKRCTPYGFEIGMSKYEVRRVCGEPDFEDTRWRYYKHGVQRVDEWVYEFGSRQYPRELHFVDGRLDNVDRIN